MINNDTIATEFFTKKYVTLRSSISSDFVMESGLIDQSVSGVYFDDGHPLVKQSIMDAFKDYKPEILLFVVETHSFGQIVKDGTGAIFESLIANNDDALNVEASWRPTDEQSLFHRSIVKRAIDKLFSDVLRTDDFVDDVVFQRNAPSDRFEIENLTGKRVGFLLSPKQGTHNYKFTFNRVGSQFNATDSFTLRLFKGNTEIQTFTVNGGQEFVWDDLITFDLDDAVYFLTYEQDDLTARAINPYQFESISFIDTFCNDYLNVQPFIADASMDLTEISEGEFRYGTNWGLALDFTVCQDLTVWINRNLQKFSKGIQLQYTYDLLEEFVYNANDRSSAKQRNTQSTRLAEIEIINLENDTIARRLMFEKRKLKKTVEQLAVNDQSFAKKEDCIWEQDFS